jgi:hypothetical protein
MDSLMMATPRGDPDFGNEITLNRVLWATGISAIHGGPGDTLRSDDADLNEDRSPAEMPAVDQKPALYIIIQSGETMGIHGLFPFKALNMSCWTNPCYSSSFHGNMGI